MRSSFTAEIHRTDHPNCDDAAQLIYEAAQGSELSFGRLVKLSKSRLLSIVLRTNPNLAQAEEVLQEVYLKIWAQADKFCTSKASGNAWMASIALNAAIDSMRRNACRPTFEPHDVDVDPYETIDSPLLGPMQSLMAEQLRCVLATSLELLTTDQRIVLCLSFFDEQSHSQIAASLGKPLGSIKTLIRRGLISLQSSVSYELC